jgi:hypothetical protein
MEHVLVAETERWSAMSAEQLIAELSRAEQNYRINAGQTEYQFEVMLLENTKTYVHVSVSVDDGRLWYSISPLSRSFIRQKEL